MNYTAMRESVKYIRFRSKIEWAGELKESLVKIIGNTYVQNYSNHPLLTQRFY